MIEGMWAARFRGEYATTSQQPKSLPQRALKTAAEFAEGTQFSSGFDIGLESLVPAFET